jgi:hypothetical protein
MGNTPTGAFGPYYVCVQSNRMFRSCRHNAWFSQRFDQARFAYFNRTAKTYSAKPGWKTLKIHGTCPR